MRMPALDISLVVRLVTLALVTSYAAPAAGQGVEYGAKGGLIIASVSNVSEISSTSDSGAGRRFGPTVGGFVSLHVWKPWLSVQPEVLVTAKGATLEKGDLDEQALRLNYVEIPLLLKMKAPSGGDNKALYLIAGPQLAFKLSTRIDDEDIGDRLKSTDFGVTLGGGLEWGRFLFEGRYTEGFANIASDANDPVRTRGIAAMVGLRF
jgi:hypothetical protein